MAFSFSSLLSRSLIALIVLVLIQQRCFAQAKFSQQNDHETACRLDRLSTLEPSKRVESEGGVTEYWDDKNEQLQCVGVSLVRYTIRPKGFLLPFYANAPRIHYVLQGIGIQETVISGCPETYQEQTAEGDQHQKIHSTREGDVIVVPAASAQWIYNNGQIDLVLFSLIDTANEDNQLDLKVRKFFLAGKPLEEQSQEMGLELPRKQSKKIEEGTNIFSGLKVEIVAESFGISIELVEKVQGFNDTRGSIILVEEGLDFLTPVIEEELQQQQREKEEEKRGKRGGSCSGDGSNGLEETLCTLRLVHQLAESTDADKYNPRGGYLTGLNTPNLPVLKYVQLGVDRGALYKKAMMVPHYNINCHAIIYGIKGSCWIQVVANGGKTVFDGMVREGQILIVPQHFVVVKKASSEGFDWIAIKTSDNPMINPLSGKLSLLRAMPEAVLMHSYRISREEAQGLKKKGELTLFSPEAKSLRKRYYN